MDKLHKSLTTGRAISFILIIAMFVNTMLPVHYDLHHHSSPDSTSHSHSIDLHSISDTSHHDENADIFDATPQVMSKKVNAKPSDLVLLALILLLLPLLDYRILKRLKYITIGFKQSPSRHLSPFLRAHHFKHHILAIKLTVGLLAAVYSAA